MTPLQQYSSVAAGRHVIIVAQGGTTVNRSVEVSAGASASVFVALGSRGKEQQRLVCPRRARGTADS